MWEGTGGAGEAIGRQVQTPQEHGEPPAEAWRAWKPILTLSGHASGGRLDQALDQSPPHRSCGRSRLGLGRAGVPLAALAGATRLWGRALWKEVESRRCSTGEGRGTGVLK